MVSKAHFDAIRKSYRTRLIAIAEERATASVKVAECLAEFDGDGGACEEWIAAHDDLELKWQSIVEDLGRMDRAERILDTPPGPPPLPRSSRPREWGSS